MCSLGSRLRLSFHPPCRPQHLPMTRFWSQSLGDHTLVGFAHVLRVGWIQFLRVGPWVSPPFTTVLAGLAPRRVDPSPALPLSSWLVPGASSLHSSGVDQPPLNQPREEECLAHRLRQLGVSGHQEPLEWSCWPSF